MIHEDEVVVYKFGGASIKDQAGFERLVNLFKKFHPRSLLIVVSALGKTTNALEKVCLAFYRHDTIEAYALLDDVKNEHLRLLEGMFVPGHRVFNEVSDLFLEIEWVLEDPVSPSFDFLYDQIVAIGELLSSRMLSAYLVDNGLPNLWADARDYIKTDNSYREATIDLALSQSAVLGSLKAQLDSGWVLSQGFIGSSSENYTTTLGREGSDYSAAVFASLLSAGSLTVWKDVPGIMNADPAKINGASLLEQLSYAEASELAFYGAKVIHPKTLAPLEKKDIALYVRSFLEPWAMGTRVTTTAGIPRVPSFIFKDDQLLISIQTRDATYMIEEHLSQIFALFHRYHVRINMMESSALSFSVAVNQTTLPEVNSSLIAALAERYDVKYNRGLKLITVRNYSCNPAWVAEIFENAEILVENSTRVTLQRLVRPRSITT